MDLEHAKRWRKALGDEEFRAKFPQEAIKLSVEDAIEKLKKDDIHNTKLPKGNKGKEDSSM